MYPELWLFGFIVSCLKVLSEYEGKWHRLDIRILCMNLINEAASIVDGPLARRIGAVAGQEIAEHLHKVAASLRQKIFWLAIPKEDTLLYLRSTLTQAAINIASANWDGLDKTDNIAKQKSFLIQIRGIAHTSSVAILPLLFVIIVQIYYPNLLDGPQESIATMGSFLWAVVSLLSAFDPGYRDKLGVFGNLTGLLPGRK